MKKEKKSYFNHIQISFPIDFPRIFAKLQKPTTIWSSTELCLQENLIQLRAIRWTKKTHIYYIYYIFIFGGNRELFSTTPDTNSWSRTLFTFTAPSSPAHHLSSRENKEKKVDRGDLRLADYRPHQNVVTKHLVTVSWINDNHSVRTYFTIIRTINIIFFFSHLTINLSIGDIEA